MAEKAILFDSTKCTGCRGCQVACKQWNDLEAETTQNTGTYENPPDLSPQTYLKMRFNEVDESDGKLAWLFTRQACMHCKDAGCVQVCPTGAVSHREEGFVTIDRDKCTGCGYCVEACPFNVPRLEGNSLTGKALMYKCTFCVDRVDNGLSPACVKTCPTGALAFGDRDEMVAKAEARVVEVGGSAHLYGKKELDGLHVLYVLSHPLEEHKLPADPQVSPAVTLWQDILQPVGYGVVGVVAGGLLLNYMVARARMVKQKEGK
jgi:formate dehydrogenase iron-sulfur subunit